MARLLIVARDDLPTDSSGRLPQPLVHQLGRISRRGVRLLMLATQPEDWHPTRGTLDSALSGQQQLYQQLETAGIHLDGVVYSTSEGLARQSSINQSIEDVRDRYGSVESITLLSSDNAVMDGLDKTLATVMLLAPANNEAPGQALAGVLENIIIELDEAASA